MVGAHVHVWHRANPNGALAKSRFARSVPARVDVLAGDADYAHERIQLLEDHEGNDMVLVDPCHAPVGAAT